MTPQLRETIHTITVELSLMVAPVVQVNFIRFIEPVQISYSGLEQWPGEVYPSQHAESSHGSSI